MATVQLTERDQLLTLILLLPDDQVAEVTKFVKDLEIQILAGEHIQVGERVTIVIQHTDDPNWSDEGITAAELERRNQIDQAAADAVRDEPTEPLEDVLRELGID